MHSLLSPSHTSASPHTTLHPWPLCGTNPHTLLPLGQAVTDTPSRWLTHTAAGNWGAVGAPSLRPPPPSKELSGPGCPGGQEDPGAGSICRKHGYLRRFIFKPSFSQTWLLWGGGGWNRASSIACI